MHMAGADLRTPVTDSTQVPGLWWDLQFSYTEKANSLTSHTLVTNAEYMRLLYAC